MSARSRWAGKLNTDRNRARWAVRVVVVAVVASLAMTLVQVASVQAATSPVAALRAAPVAPVVAAPRSFLKPAVTTAAAATGRLAGWGNPARYGTLGVAVGNDIIYSPAQVPAPSTFVAVDSAGETVSALDGDGAVWQWGQTGVDTGTDFATYSSVPMKVAGLTGVTAIAQTNFTLAVVRSDGTVYTKGGNSWGELGTGSTARGSNTPVQVTGLTGITAVAAATNTFFARRSDGTVWAWGEGSSGMLGGATGPARSPVQIAGLSGVSKIGAQWSTGYAILNDGTVRAWGAFVGDGTGNGSATPKLVSGLTGVTQVTGGSSNAYALKSDGTVWVWGWSDIGQPLGSQVVYKSPVQVPGVAGATAIASTYGTAFALMSDKTMRSWGGNGDGVLGLGGPGKTNIPVTVPGLAGVSRLAAVSFSSTMFAVATSVQAGATGPNERVGFFNPAELGYCFSCAGDPVDLDTGDFFYSATDLSVPGRGVPLEWTRNYDTRLKDDDGRLGYGWTDSYDLTLDEDEDGVVRIQQGNGSRTIYTPDGSGGYLVPTRVLATLVKNADATFAYTVRRTTTYVFSAAGKLITIRDRNGYQTTIGYDASQRLSTVTDPAGRKLTYTYDSHNRVYTVKDAKPRTITYTYDADGNLATVTDADGRLWTYSYDTSHNLTGIKDPRLKSITNSYTNDVVRSQTDRAGNITLFDYGTATADGSHTTTVTHPRGNKDVYTFRLGQTTSIVRGQGSAEQSTETRTYDPVTNGLLKVVDGRNKITQYTYDAYGNPLTRTDPLNHTTSRTYNAFNEPLTDTDPLNVTTTYTYDTKGNLKSSSRPLIGTSPLQNALVTYTYGDTAHPGDVTQMTDARGKVTNYGYDANGYVSSVIDPTNRKTTTAYNVIGWVTSTTSAAGNVTGATPSQHFTTYSDFTGFGAAKTVTDALGHVTKYAFDPDQNRTDVTDADNRHTVSTFDGNGRVTSVTRPDTTVVATAFDGNGNVKSQTDALTHATTFTYDAVDRLSTRTDQAGRVTKATYDGNSNIKTLDEPGAGTARLVTTNTFDDANRLTNRAYSDGTTPAVTYGYDNASHRTSMADGTGTTTYLYDSLNRVYQITDGTGAVVKYGYDLSSNVKSLTYAAGKVVTRTFDDAGRLNGVTSWLTTTPTTFGYDADGNWATTTYPNSVTATRTYDNARNLNGLAYAKAGTGIGSYGYTRTPGNQLSTATPANGAPTGAETYAYTPNGQLKSTAGPTAPNIWTYDNADRLTKTLAGTTFTYDTVDQLATSTASSGTVTTYAYDARGNRSSSKVGTAAPSVYTYDQANRLISSKSPAGTTATFVYNGDGLRTAGTPNGGALQQRQYDTVTSGLPLVIGNYGVYYLYGPGDTPIEQISTTNAVFLHQDQLGSTALLTDATGATTGTYKYDAYGKVTVHTGANVRLQFNGQFADDDTGFLYLRSRYYDPTTGQFVTVDPMLAMTRSRYGYAAQNPLNIVDPSGLLHIDWGQVGQAAGYSALALGGAAACVFGGCEAIGLAGAGAGGVMLVGSAMEWAVSGAILGGGVNATGQMLMEGDGPSWLNEQNCDETPTEQVDDLISRPGQIASRFGRSVREIKDAIHAVKRNLPKSSAIRNPDVSVDPNTGEVYPQLPGGGHGDSIGNLWDFLGE